MKIYIVVHSIREYGDCDLEIESVHKNRKSAEEKIKFIADGTINYDYYHIEEHDLID